MVKKISAIILALVLCLSVVVVPASANFADDYELPADARVAFRVELDKTHYSAGDIATVSVYVRANEDYEFGPGAITIGVNTAVFNATDNTNKTIKASATSNEVYNSFYKEAGSATWSFLTSSTNTNVKKIVGANTSEENSLYNAYVKVVVARNMNGDHYNAAELNNGLPGAEINSCEEPFVTFQLKVASDVADGTAVNVAITSGTIASSAKQSYFDIFNDPGNSSTKTSTNATTTDMTAGLVADAVIGAASIVNPLRDGQIRFHKDAAGAYANSFDVRALAVIEGNDFTTKFGDIAAAKTKIKEVGFVFAQGANVTAPSMDAVKALVEKGTAAAGYTKKTVNYISTSVEPGSYVFSCIAAGIPDAEKTNSLVAVGYIAWDSNADGEVDSYAYYPTAQTISFKQLYNVNNDQANANYGWNLQDIA